MSDPTPQVWPYQGATAYLISTHRTPPRIVNSGRITSVSRTRVTVLYETETTSRATQYRRSDLKPIGSSPYYPEKLHSEESPAYRTAVQATAVRTAAMDLATEVNAIHARGDLESGDPERVKSAAAALFGKAVQTLSDLHKLARTEGQ